MTVSLIFMLLFLRGDVGVPSKDRALIDECLRHVSLSYKACLWKAAQTTRYGDLVAECKVERDRQQTLCHEQRSEPWL